MRNFPRGTRHGERFVDDGNTGLRAPGDEDPGGWLERAQGVRAGEDTVPGGREPGSTHPGGRRGEGAEAGAQYVQVGAGTCPWPAAGRTAPSTGLRERQAADGFAESSQDSGDVTGPPARIPSRHTPAPYELHRAASEFLTLRHSEERLGDPARRIAAAHKEIAETGTYRHTTEELVFGARVAWRNANRCIGRLYWHSLCVRDRRDVRDTRDVAEASADHLREATRGGRIRALITVFAPDEPGRPGPRIWNEQLIRYAGYARPDGGVTGDPRNEGLTTLALRLGWPGGPGTPFDVLPLVIQGADDQPRWFALPQDAVLEVELGHPEYTWWRALGLRWHAVPALANMCLEIGGVCYPAAPFNGWYMGTEIGARNLADTDRYDLLPHIADRLGLDTRTDRSLWKDRALVELNRSVLHSFDRAGVTVTDHHTESRRFLTHLGREERKGRRVGADWSWIVPPISGSATPVFHRTYEAVERSPAYVHHPEAHERARGAVLV
ncbi:nitric oxide synthase oxygenase [Streptomyces sp. NBC_00035]|uniref:nitric oxide synthase oxygenase n=1 Tax=Streptomyces sp. NBC_00035 TaxID=2903614 RepID=UPI00386F79AD